MGMELVELHIAGYWVSAGDFLSHTSNNFGSWYRLQINCYCCCFGKLAAAYCSSCPGWVGAVGKENKVKLIKDNIVQPALAMIMRIKMMKLKIMMMMMTVVLVAPHMFEQGRCLINLTGKNAQVHRMPMHGT